MAGITVADIDRGSLPTITSQELLVRKMTPQECEGNVTGISLRITCCLCLTTVFAELVYSLLETLPRARLAHIRRRIEPLLQLDIVGVSGVLLSPHH